MKRSIITPVLILALCCIYSCKKDSTDNDSKNYVSFIANGKAYNFDFCYANVITQAYNEEQKQFTKLIAGIEANIDDSTNIIYPPSMAITFEGTSTGIYYKEDFIGWLYMIMFQSEIAYYSFPKSIDDVKGDFELNISEHDLSSQIIAGTFHGLIYGITETDSVLIENGKFRGQVYSSPEN